MLQGRSREVSVLKMPLDLSLALDKEVFDIISGFRSGVEAKNFLCSAVLYYARSPLVLSANALTESLNGLQSVLSRLNFSYTGLQLEKILSKLDRLEGVSVGVVSSNERSEVTQKSVSDKESNALDSDTASALVSLRDKFKV